MKNTKIKALAITIIMLLIFTLDFVYAKTSTEINMCQYRGVLSTLKICGLIIQILKVVAPLIITIMTLTEFFKVVVSGKTEDMTKSISQTGKRLVAAFIIFLVPGTLNYVFNTFVHANTQSASYKACTTCLFKPGNCTIPKTDPETYTSD